MFVSCGRKNTQRHPKHGNEQDVYKRAGGDAPKHGARTSRRIYKCDSPQRPEHDLFGATASLPTGQRVTELMQQNDEEEQDVFVRCPNLRAVEARSLELDRGDNEPGKMEIDLDAAEFEETNRAAHDD